MPPPPHTHPTLPFCPYLQSSACNSELISSFQIRTRSVELTLKNLWHQSFIAFTSLEQCAESLLTTSMLKKSQLMTIGKSGQGWMTVLHSDMEKQYWRVFPPHNCCQVSSETDRNWCKKGEKKGKKVWDWVNSAHPCHMSLVYQFPHCSLVWQTKNITCGAYTTPRATERTSSNKPTQE